MEEHGHVGSGHDSTTGKGGGGVVREVRVRREKRREHRKKELGVEEVVRVDRRGEGLKGGIELKKK